MEGRKFTTFDILEEVWKRSIEVDSPTSLTPSTLKVVPHSTSARCTLLSLLLFRDYPLRTLLWSPRNKRHIPISE